MRKEAEKRKEGRKGVGQKGDGKDGREREVGGGVKKREGGGGGVGNQFSLVTKVLQHVGQVLSSFII